MSCENLEIPKPGNSKCYTTLYGIPYQNAGRTVGGTTYPIKGIVLHCEEMTLAGLCNELKCRTRSSVISGSWHNSYHYGIGVSPSSGPVLQFVEDGNIAWSFGSYKSNTYVMVPPPNLAINWPVLQAEFGLNTTPDVYTLNIALAMGRIVEATQAGCYECPTASGLEDSQHQQLVQLLAYLAKEYSIPIDQDHIQFHDNIHCGMGEECPCTDIESLLLEVEAFCPPCPEEATPHPEAEPDDNILYVQAITEPCCPDSFGCVVNMPWNACFVGDLAEDGDLTSYILGLSQDPETGQWCLTRGCLGVMPPLIGCGTTDDPLRLDRCLIDDWLHTYDPLSAVQEVLGIDENGCLTLQSNDSWFDMVACMQPENSEATPEWVLAKTDNACPEWVTPKQIVIAGLTVEDTNCINLMFVDGVLTANPIIDPDPNNVLICGPNGLNAPVPRLVSSDCIEVVDNMDGTIQVEPVIAPTQAGVDNIIQCIPGQGLFVPETTFIAGSDCISVTTLGDEVTVDVVISPDAGNLLECRANGLFSGFTAQDTDCINLDLTNGILTATPAISTDVGGIQNTLQCLGSGLYVPRGANANTQGPIIGDGSDINPIDIDFSQLDANDLCDFGGAIPNGVLVEILGRDNAECLRVQTLEDVIANALIVQDTNCIDLSLIGNILTATPVIAPAQAGVANQLQCLAGGLYVPTAAGLSVQDTTCIDLTLTNGVLSATPIIDPSGDNALTCGVGGLYVPVASGLQVNDTDCVNHSLVGGVLSTILNIAGPQGGIPNILSCVAGQGLYVPESHILVQDTTCIDLTFVGGILRADIIIDPTGDNQIQCLPSGLYVPPSAGITVDDTDCISLNLAASVITATPILAPAQGGIANSLQCLAGEGLYVPSSEAPFIVNINDTDCINLSVIGGTLTADPIIAPAQGNCGNALQCIPGQGLYVEQHHETASGTATSGDVTLNPAPNVTVTGLSPLQAVLVNPSTCRSMLVEIFFSNYGGGFAFQSVNPIDAQYAVQPVLLVNGVPALNPSSNDSFLQLDDLQAATFAINMSEKPFRSLAIIGPGGVLTVSASATVSVITPHNATVDSSIQITGAIINLIGHTI